MINKPYTHPGKPDHVMRVYRATCLHAKKAYGSSRALIFGMDYVHEYLAAKRSVLKEWNLIRPHMLRGAKVKWSTKEV